MGEWWVLVEERKVDWGLWAVAEGVGGSGGHAPWKGGAMEFGGCSSMAGSGKKRRRSGK
jgi:hypothetical protein